MFRADRVYYALTADVASVLKAANKAFLVSDFIAFHISLLVSFPFYYLASACWPVTEQIKLAVAAAAPAPAVQFLLNLAQCDDFPFRFPLSAPESNVVLNLTQAENEHCRFLLIFAYFAPTIVFLFSLFLSPAVKHVSAQKSCTVQCFSIFFSAE